MLLLFTGENTYEIAKALDALKRDFPGSVERIDGAEFDPSLVNNIISGMTLFEDRRMIILEEASRQGELWDALAISITTLSDDITLILIEPKPDRRTRSYKTIASHAEIRTFDLLPTKNSAVAVQWVQQRAQDEGFELTSAQARVLIDRVGFDQWALEHAIEKLAVLDVVHEDTIREIVDATPQESVFELFDAALGGRSDRISPLLASLETMEEPHRLIGLLQGQVFQLIVLSTAIHSGNEVAKEFGFHPYGMSKLARHAHQIDRRGVKRLAQICDETDRDLKSTTADPWLLVERMMQKVANVVH